MIYATVPHQETISEKQKNNIIDWIKALRSGKYSHARFSLKNNNGFCCLGVACEINGDFNEGGVMKNVSPYTSLPDAYLFSERFGFHFHSDVTINANHENICLSSINDRSTNDCFNQIADIVEACFISKTIIQVEII